jgi:hypothetical protein
MAENIRPTPSALEDQREDQDRSYAFISESEIGPLFLGNAEMAENISPTPSALEYQRGSQGRSCATMSEIKSDLLNNKMAENIPSAPSALEYYRKTWIRSFPPYQSTKVQLAVLKRQKTDLYPLLLKTTVKIGVIPPCQRSNPVSF